MECIITIRHSNLLWITSRCALGISNVRNLGCSSQHSVPSRKLALRCEAMSPVAVSSSYHCLWNETSVSSNCQSPSSGLPQLAKNQVRDKSVNFIFSQRNFEFCSGKFILFWYFKVFITFIEVTTKNWKTDEACYMLFTNCSVLRSVKFALDQGKVREVFSFHCKWRPCSLQYGQSNAISYYQQQHPFALNYKTAWLAFCLTSKLNKTKLIKPFASWTPSN